MNLWRHITTQTQISSFFFFNDTATTEIYTLSLHDALPISIDRVRPGRIVQAGIAEGGAERETASERDGLVGSGVDRKSTRLNSSHLVISYAVFCLKKKKTESVDEDVCISISTFIVLVLVML